MRQGKYSLAMRKLQQALKRDPNQKLHITEADIWLQQGKSEFNKGQYGAAETSLNQALTLGRYDDTYYWLAKCLLAQDRSAEALDQLQTAFENQTLPKDLGGCLLKLLVLNDQVDTVEKLLKNQSKWFSASHLYWARGALAIQADNPKAALTHFQKVKQSTSPGDSPATWQVYAHQCAGDWAQAEKLLGSYAQSFGSRFFRLGNADHPASQRLAIHQAAQSSLSLSRVLNNLDASLPQAEAAWVLEVVRLAREENWVVAGHVILDVPEEAMAIYPELQRLRRPLLLLAGKQAHQEQDLEETVEFWSEVVDQPEFDPHLAIQLQRLASLVGDFRQSYQLLKRLLAWVQAEAKRDPPSWPQSRLDPVQARLHCWLADKQMALGHFADAQQNVRQAEQLAPDHPDVLGRRGLSALVQGKKKVAISLLTQALEAGCEFSEVYSHLVKALKDDPDALKTVRRKFGQRFGDVGAEAEANIPAWVEALTFQNYWMMEDFVLGKSTKDPPLTALKIFLDSAEDEPSSGQKITLDQEKAVKRWDALLKESSSADQVEVLKAIYLVVQQHARRNQKGISALQGRYAQQLSHLTAEVPAANIAHLMLLALKNSAPDQLEAALTMALRRSTQPGHLLAQAQLQLHYFDHTQALAPFIDFQLQQEPQNPLLLLAKATLYPPNSSEYKSYHDQGFAIARRLQDAEALQAFREADWMMSQELTRRVVGNQINRMGSLDEIDMIKILKRVAKEAVGHDVPPEIINQMLPDLIDQMMGGGFEDADDFEDDFDPFFLPPPNARKRSTKKKKKPWFKL
ncbi:tetratricopeptide repeat protein [Synechococcales cyanobacterium C]|uniref:Tetratricopeptide repeat protein n=1 Tax=Petrachloros mirabilis ULC683 TaxID=2781853 RepID=A0A8K2A8V9_9CYAN|nr:tetratricopeptide repeat protein [Petrachloros mirabilis ULC683]